MKTISIILKTSECLGDYNVPVSIAQEFRNEETVRDLVERLRLSITDCVELRVIHVQGKEGKS